MKLSGYLSVPNVFGTFLLRSSSTPILEPLTKNWRTTSQLSSTLTASMRMSVFSIRRASSSIEGTSSTQGGHQVAQKLTSTG